MGDYRVDDVIKDIFNQEDPNFKPTDKIQLVVNALEYCKEELSTFIVTSSFDIPSILEESDDLCSSSNLLVANWKKCKKAIEIETMADIVKSIENYSQLSKELKTVKFGESLVGDVLQCGNLMKEYHDAFAGENYSDAVESLCNTLEILDKPAAGLNILEIAGKTREIAQGALNNVINILHTNFEELMNISIKELGKKKIVTINLKIKDDNRCFDVINALFISKKISVKVHEFADSLMEEVLNPMVHHTSTVNWNEVDDTFTITIYNKQTIKTPYTEVISNHTQIFEILSKKLQFTLDANKSLFKMIGEHLCDRYSDMVMHECFVFTIPKNIADLNNYDPIAQDIAKFQNYLNDKEFFPPESNISILSYIKDIEKHFAQSAATHLLDTARTIMLKDLSVTMSIGVTGIDNFSDPLSPSSKQEALSRMEKNIPKSLFYFPRCMISKSAQELLDHLYTIMEQASQCEDVVCKKLYCVARMIFDLYEAVVPYHHEKYLQTIPQYVGKFILLYINAHAGMGLSLL